MVTIRIPNMSIFLNPTFIITNFRSVLHSIDHPKNDVNALSSILKETVTNPKTMHVEKTTMDKDLLDEECTSIFSSNHSSIVSFSSPFKQIEDRFISSIASSPNSFTSSNLPFNASSIPSSPLFSPASSLSGSSSSTKASYLELLQTGSSEPQTTLMEDPHLSETKKNVLKLETQFHFPSLTDELEMENLLADTSNDNMAKPNELDSTLLNLKSNNKEIVPKKEQNDSSSLKKSQLPILSDPAIDFHDMDVTLFSNKFTNALPLPLSMKQVKFSENSNQPSILTSLLKQNQNSLKGSQSVYLKYSHLGEVNPSDSFSITLTLSYGSTKHKLSFHINPTATVEQVIGYAMFLFYDASVLVPLSFNVHGWNLYLMDDDDEEEDDLDKFDKEEEEEEEDSDDDFALPPLNMNQPISNFGSHLFSLTPKTLLWIHSELVSTPSVPFAVDSTTTLTSILHEVCEYLDIQEESTLALYFAKNQELVSSSVTTVADLNGDFEFLLKRKGETSDPQVSNEDQGTGLSASYLKYMQDRNPKGYSSQSSLESFNGSILSKYLRKSAQSPFALPSDSLKGFNSNSNKYIVSRKTHFGLTNQEYVLTLDESFLSILPILNSTNSDTQNQMELIGISNILSCTLHKSKYVQLMIYSNGIRKKKIYRFKLSTNTEAVELVNRIQKIQEKVLSTRKE